MSKMDFAALLCSRLCHDLVSPVGAITNGIEILSDEHDAAMREQVMDLLQKSAQQTGNKLQFFRLAFGAAGGFSARLDTREASKAIETFLDSSRIKATMAFEMPDAPKGIVKLLLNLVLVASETLIRGGLLDIAMRQDGKTIDISVAVRGDRYILQDTVRQALTGQVAEADIEPRSAPAFLVATIVEEMGGSLAVIDNDDGSHEFRICLANAEMIGE